MTHIISFKKCPSLFFISFLFLFPDIVGANNFAFMTNESGMADTILLWAAIIIGILASLMVLHSAYIIGGGVIQEVYNRFGVGMLLVIAGLVTTMLSSYFPEYVFLSVQYGLFIIGFTVMAFGAKRLLTAAGLK